MFSSSKIPHMESGSITIAIPSSLAPGGTRAKRFNKKWCKDGSLHRIRLSLTAVESAAAAAAAIRCSTTTWRLMGWGHVCYSQGPTQLVPVWLYSLHTHTAHRTPLARLDATILLT